MARSREHVDALAKLRVSTKRWRNKVTWDSQAGPVPGQAFDLVHINLFFQGTKVQNKRALQTHRQIQGNDRHWDLKLDFGACDHRYWRAITAVGNVKLAFAERQQIVVDLFFPGNVKRGLSGRAPVGPKNTLQTRKQARVLQLDSLAARCFQCNLFRRSHLHEKLREI